MTGACSGHAGTSAGRARLKAVVLGLAPVAVCLTTLGCLGRRWLRVVVVDGSSMAPTYRDGDALLALYRGGRRHAPRAGEVVVIRAPAPHWRADQPVDEAFVRVVKRVTAAPGDPRPDGAGAVPSDSVYVEGDSGQGYDSRTFGPLPQSEVLGRVLGRLRPAAGPR